MKITFIGAGNMGGATARGLAARKLAAADITMADANAAVLEKFAAQGFATSTDNVAAIKDAEIVVIVVKPFVVADVVARIAPHIKDKLVVCMAPGVKPDELLSMFGEPAPAVVYAIPNTAIEIGESVTFVVKVTASDEQVEIVKSLYGSLGATLEVPARLLAAGTSVASCGIAYAMRYIRAAVEGAVELGMYPKDALEAVCATVRGAAGLIMAHGSHPEAEIDKVTTPGGLTIRGLNAMEEAGFTTAVIKGLKAGTL